jgi:hypothetical protein
MKKKLLAFTCALVFSGIAHAQTITTISGGFLNPGGMAHDSAYNIYVAEAGTGNDNGRISMIHFGIKYTVIDSLPSVFDTIIQDVVGPWRCYITNSGILTVIIGGKQEVNMGSIITFDISSYIPGGQPQTVADAIDIFHVASWALSNGFVDSDIFSAAWDSTGNTYISDAGANAIFRRDYLTNSITVVDTFPQIPNSTTPFPSYIDYVPTKIINGPDGNFLVSNLSGFPFLPGYASIVSVDSAGNDSTLVMGLTLAVDMELDSINNKIYVLQFGQFDTSTFIPIANSAMIVSIDSMGVIDTVASGFGPSAGMMADSSGGFYVTAVYAGTLLHITFPTAVHELHNYLEGVSVFPNPFNGELNININSPSASEISYEVHDLAGSLIFHSSLNVLPPGTTSIHWNGMDENGNHINKGVYFLTVRNGSRQVNFKLVSL